ncbi:MAG: hypothetical protein ACJAU9_000666 [Lentimonas sp.]|jgi:hypothetical protein
MPEIFFSSGFGLIAAVGQVSGFFSVVSLLRFFFRSSLI